ncbi:conserved hypothetical protein [Desulfamplus magnetovallimortis]|uniref:PNPLA domain-containing protein n=1 Tax=Desulfamplus magnetovallimortis TaxID=1246637 RepID=A0A1W1HJC8_9BACT|nr:hypothetical protein [Desulfamplus magnetovallimortis]SLM32570.1 conserved hypothetical protein [Desulfamplus magnetovallimortis]
MSEYLSFYAGEKAFSVIRERGLTQDMVNVVSGAAGGPKWLIMGALDRFLFGEWFQKRSEPLFLAGSSAGAWRFAAVSQKKPVKAIKRLTHAYVNQWYPARPSMERVDSECKKIIDSFIDKSALTEIFNHPFCRPAFFSVHSKWPVQSDNKVILSAGMAGAAIVNLFDRNLLKHFFTRTLFYHPSDTPPFYNMNDMPMQRVALTSDNFKKALLSSGSIPLLMPGVGGISGAVDGIYRDGGVIDYHLDIPFSGYLKSDQIFRRAKNNPVSRELIHNEEHGQLLSDLSRLNKISASEQVVLFPHYTDRVVPGWLDKGLPWRKPHREYFSNVLMIVPSRKFLNMLPGKKIPDRGDFSLFKGKNRKRIEQWNIALKYSEILGEELCRIFNSGTLRSIINPLGLI